MDRGKLKELIIAGVREIQELSGRGWTDLADRDGVVGALDGFDSIAAIEATAVIEHRVIQGGLGTKVNAETLFVDDGRPLTLSEVVDRLEAAVAGA